MKGLFLICLLITYGQSAETGEKRVFRGNKEHPFQSEEDAENYEKKIADMREGHMGVNGFNSAEKNPKDNEDPKDGNDVEKAFQMMKKDDEMMSPGASAVFQGVMKQEHAIIPGNHPNKINKFTKMRGSSQETVVGSMNDLNRVMGADRGPFDHDLDDPAGGTGAYSSIKSTENNGILRPHDDMNHVGAGMNVNQEAAKSVESKTFSAKHLVHHKLKGKANFVNVFNGQESHMKIKDIHNGMHRGGKLMKPVVQQIEEPLEEVTEEIIPTELPTANVVNPEHSHQHVVAPVVSNVVHDQKEQDLHNLCGICERQCSIPGTRRSNIYGSLKNTSSMVENERKVEAEKQEKEEVITGFSNAMDHLVKGVNGIKDTWGLRRRWAKTLRGKTSHNEKVLREAVERMEKRFDDAKKKFTKKVENAWALGKLEVIAELLDGYQAGDVIGCLSQMDFLKDGPTEQQMKPQWVMKKVKKVKRKRKLAQKKTSTIKQKVVNLKRIDKIAKKLLSEPQTGTREGPRDSRAQLRETEQNDTVTEDESEDS